MKTLIAEDDSTTCLLLQEFFTKYGETHVAENGKQAIEAFGRAVKEGHPYDLVCLDILMPEVDGHAVLKAIRKLEHEKGIRESDAVKIVMITALANRDNVFKAGQERCDAYIVKPISPEKVLSKLRDLELLQEDDS